MQLQQNISLKPYNTFGIDVSAEYLMVLNDAAILQQVNTDKSLPAEKHILGGGSNVLLTKAVKGLVLLNKLKGITIEREDEEHVWVKVSAGEIWHELVHYAIDNNLAGIENLALIPGTVGAAPIQNIGAYGVEAKETIDSVRCWHWEEQEFITYSNASCRFGYRDSIFKQELKNKVFVTDVTFRLNKKPAYNISYGAIEQELQKMNVTSLSIKAIADAVIAIRSSKLPDPKQTGNAGSFFKNPTITYEHFELLQTNYPNIPSYPVSDIMIKVPAGWLIEQCGWKGVKRGDAGVHEKQALVIANYGNASGKEIWELSEEILESVKERFGIILEREVQVW
ncbi:MAG: UDP-N-acetylenolpyruvoylglucosamine reductase [Bacteroidetes bacterium 46-16]|nr:MAG: UDP-N-acetylenolpyruvoylglucosamine reductase [Bacteroidetes bacterium 46-16]